MADKRDFQSQFRAAKSGRAAAPKLTRDQIRALKEQQKQQQVEQQLAQQAQQQQQQSDADIKEGVQPKSGMLPPPPRPRGQAASYHADSQATQIHGVGLAAAGLESSVNQVVEGVPGTQHSVTSAFHPVPVRAPVGMASPQAAVPSQPAGEGGAQLPADFFSERDQQDAQAQHSHSGEGSVDGAGDARAAAEVGPTAESAIPKGFFEDKQAEAKARGEKPISKNELATEYAAFMKHVEADSAAAASQQAAEEQEDAADREDRDDFEQFVRWQRLQHLKQAVASRGQAVDQDDALDAAVAALTAVEGAALLPDQHLPKRRRVATAAELAGEGSSSGEDEGDEEPDLLDWRAKKSSAPA